MRRPIDVRSAAIATARELLIGVFFLTLAVAFTWPLARNLDRAVSDPGDPYLTTWILDWDLHALVHAPLGIFDAPVFHPARQTLAFSENLIGIAVLLLPFKIAGAGPIAINNFALLLGFAFSGYAGSVLCRVAGASTAAAVVGGIFYAFVPFRFDHIAHIQFVWGGWLALVLAALLYFSRMPNARRAALLAGAIVMNGLTNIHQLAFAAVAIVITAVLLASAREEPFERRTWMLFLTSVVTAHLVLIPFLLPYKSVSERYEMKRNPEEVRMGSATWSDWIVATDRSAVYGDTQAAKRASGEHRLFPGLVVLLLAAAALLTARREPTVLRAASPRALRWARAMDTVLVAAIAITYFALTDGRVIVKLGGVRLLRAEWSTAVTVTLLLVVIRAVIAVPDVAGGGTLRQRILASRYTSATLAAILWILTGLVASFGTRSFLHSFLYSKVLMFQSIRVPARWAVVAYVGLAVLAALGVDAALRGRTRRVATAVAVALAALMAYDVHPVARPWFMTAEIGGDVHRWLRDAPFRGAVVELPLTPYGENEVLAMLAATIHHRPLVNGASGFESPEHRELTELAAQTPIGDGFLVKLRSIGCGLVVVHADRLGALGDTTRQWLAREMAARRLQFVRRFDHETRGDYVFAISGSGDDVRRLAADSRPDPAGRTPLQNAEGFISSNAVSYNASPFGFVEWPREGTVVARELDVRGWALSPAGIDRVDALIGNGAHRIPCRLVDRQDINAVFPWYDRSRPAAFSLKLSERPRGVGLLTDVQIELHDRAGRTMRLRDVPIVWKSAAR